VLTFGATGEHAQVDERSLNVLNRHIDLDDLPFREPHNATNAAMACLLAYGALAYRAKNSPGSNADRLLREAESQVRTQRDRRRTVYSGRAQTTDEQRVLPQVMFDGLKAFRGLEHRMEILGTRSGVRVINNSMCTNPDAVIKSAQAIRDPVHLIIGGVNKDLDFKPLANYLANRRNRAYLFGSDRDSIDEMLGGGYPSFVRMEDAFRAATGAAREGEVIMLAPGCASSDQFGDFRDRGNVFKAIAKEWLNS
jgi:UDP-N-acetylmuramoylalanine--D-glutamate ligase